MGEEEKTKSKQKQTKKQEKEVYTIVISPARPDTETAEGEEELLDVLRQHAELLSIREDEIPSCGLFKVFKGEEVELECIKSQIKLPSPR